MIMNIFATLFTHMVTVCALVAGSRALKHQLLSTWQHLVTMIVLVVTGDGDAGGDAEGDCGV